MLMTNLLLAAMMFLPHQSVKTYAAPDHSCLSTWGGDTNNVQNIAAQRSMRLADRLNTPQGLASLFLGEVLEDQQLALQGGK
jgi:hypothetical protein